MLGLSASQLLELARRKTGLNDFGDTGFLPGFEKLIDALEHEAHLSDRGRPAVQERMVRLLANRLRFQADLSRHPEILDEPLAAPVVIISLPRAGSTKLHRLLAEGDDFQKLLFWQGYNPAPFPGVVPGLPDPRIEDAMRFLAWRSSTNAAADKAHHMEATAPEEEMYLLEFSFGIYWPTAYYNVPGYIEWLKTSDPNYVYRYLRQLLQYLQWQFCRGGSKPWILKAPPNLGYEAYIAANFPGAKFLVLHRDPLAVIPSVGALARETRKLYSVDAKYSRQASWALEQFSGAMNRHLDWRERVRDVPILDIAYRDIHRREMDVVRTIYSFLGMPLSQRAEAAMRKWSDQNAQHKHGVHEYSLEESGLSAVQIEEKFARYAREFAEYLTT